MIDEKIKRALVKELGLEEEYSKGKIAEDIGKEYSLPREVGILGDALEYIFELVYSLHPEAVPDPAFEEWRATVNEIKKTVKSDCGLKYENKRPFLKKENRKETDGCGSKYEQIKNETEC